MTSPRRVLLAGASGLVGGYLLEGLLADETVGSVHVLGRRALSRPHAKLLMHVVDFRALPELPAVDEVYLALGTTIKVAGSREAFRAVDFDANFAVAKAALKAGARRMGLVSAMGANARSSVFYNRVKGELEEALGGLPIEGLVVACPSLLMGDREALGQAPRPAEYWGQRIMGALRVLTPANFRPVRAEKVARALLREVPSARGTKRINSGDLQGY